jgi:hypothetical protein
VPRAKAAVQRDIEEMVEDMASAAGKPWHLLYKERTWAQCPLINPMCPDDLCVLPAGHVGTTEDYHVTGTMSYGQAEKFPREWMRPEGSNPQFLMQEGWRVADIMFPDDRRERRA